MIDWDGVKQTHSMEFEVRVRTVHDAQTTTPLVVASVSVESAEMRIFHMTATGDLERPRRVRTGIYWCGVDKPEGGDLAPVYHGTKIPEDEECCECHIPINKRQAMVPRV